MNARSTGSPTNACVFAGELGLLVYDLHDEPMSAAAPFDVMTAHHKRERMQLHLDAHRRALCGVETLADAALHYVSELYPFGDMHATDCTRTATALFAFFTGCTDTRTAFERQSLAGAPCPMAEEAAAAAEQQQQDSPLSSNARIHYISLTSAPHDRLLDTSSGHRLVVLQAKGRARVLHAFKDQFTLGQYMRCTASMSARQFECWWGQLQEALSAPEATVREKLFAQLLRADKFAEPVDMSWMSTRAVDVGL